MKLRRLEVKHFGGVHSAAIDFGPGLNVLYAPNETGKSTLMRAIRAALLLPISSSAHEEFVDWHTDEPPQVVLTFETKPHKIWRVDKTFGRGGSSYLEFSKDGTSFAQDVKGREVDGKIRELLDWGVAVPGAARTHGYPATYLTTALLAEQDEVTTILAQGVDGAGDGGKKRLTAALQALAEDPTFRRVLREVQTRVGEAYTTTGRKRSGKGSPWKDIQEQRLAAKNRESEVRTMLHESTSAQQKCLEQQAAVDKMRASVEDARAIRKAIDLAWEQSAARIAAQQQVDEAKAELSRIQGVHDAAAQTKLAHDAAKKQLDTVEQETVAARAEAERATTQLDDLRQQLRDLTSGTAEQERKLREQELKTKLSSLEMTELQTKQRKEAAEEQRERETKLAALRTDLAARTNRLDTIQAKIGTAEQQLQALQATIENHDRAKLAHEWIAAEAAHAQALEQQTKAAADRKAAEKKRKEADELTQEIDAITLPDAEALKTLQAQHAQLDVAEKTLEVGLTVRIAPHVKTAIDVTTDGKNKSHTISKPRDFTARAELLLGLPGMDVTISGGAAELREQAKTLRQQWDATSTPVFTDAGVTDLEQLDTKVTKAATIYRQADALRAEAENLEARADGAGAVEVTLDSALRKLRAARAALPTTVTEEDARALAAAPLKTTDLQPLQDQITQNNNALTTLRADFAREEGARNTKSIELATAEVANTKAGDTDGQTWQDALEQSTAQLKKIEAQQADLKKALTELEQSATTGVEQATAAVAAATAAQTTAHQARQQAEERRDALRQEVAELKGSWENQTKLATREDLPQAQTQVDQLQAALDKLPQPEQTIDDTQRSECHQLVEQAEQNLRVEQDTLRKLEGGLEQVGGQHVDEAMQQATERVEAIAQLEREKDLDYGAWQLLEETLKEAEAEGTVHLGKALVEPIEQRMSELTGGRYGTPAIGPTLETDAIALAGENRSLERLSIGTQEQLATLLRLTIAEKLQTFVVLDDQLVQSDPGRLKKLTAVMQQCAKTHQVLVFTCRPDDYAAETTEDIQYVDLTEKVQRSSNARG